MALKDFKALSKDTLIYGIGNASDRIIRVVLLPLYAAYLPVASYGIRNLTIPLYEILKIIILLAIDQAVIADYFKAKTPEERKVVISTGFTFSMLTSLLIGGLTYTFATPLAGILNLNTPDAPAILRLFSILTAFGPPSFVFLSFLRCERRASIYVLYAVLKSLVKIGLTVIFLVLLKRDLIGLYEVDAAMAVFFFLPVVIWIYIYARGVRFSFESLKSMFHYALPLLPSLVFFWVRTMMDRWIIKPYLGESGVGVFTFASTVSNVVSFLLLSTVNLAWTPYAFSIKENPGLPRLTSRLLTYTLLICGWALLVLGGGANELVRVVAKKPEYWSSAPLIPILLFAMGFVGGFNIIGTPCQLERRTVYFTISSVVGAGIVVLMNLFLIPLMGLYASASAWVISYGVMMILMVFFSRKFMSIPYEGKRILLVSITSVLITVGLFFWKWSAVPSWLLFLVKSFGGSVVFLGSLWALGFLLPSEQEFLARFFRGKSKKV